jgi:hypothetical protein
MPGISGATKVGAITVITFVRGGDESPSAHA